AEALHPWLGSNSHTLPHQPDEPNDLRGSSAAISPKKTNLRKIERYSRQCTIFSMSLPPFGTRQAFMSRRRALFPRDVFLRSVTSWYHSSNRSRSEFVRQLTAAFGISWSKKSAGASWFRDRHRRSTPN